MKFQCKSCGAQLDDHMAKCPYCDTMIPKGAEKEYMEKLYDLRDEMDVLKEVPLEHVRKEIKHQGGRMKKIIAAVLVVVILFCAYFVWEDKKYERDYTEDYVWEQEHFPEMTQMYENGEYEALEEIFMEAMMDDKPVWNWEYYDEFTKWMEEQE